MSSFHSRLLFWLSLTLVPLPLALRGGEEPTAAPVSVAELQARVAALEKKITELQKLRYKPTLGEFMSSVQARHAKLWFALAAENWPLAAFELHELDETLEDVTKWYPTHRDAPQPLKEMLEGGLDPALKQLEAVVKSADKTQYPAAFDELTRACNACHQATAHGYNVVKRPIAPPLSNQEFAPQPERN